MQIHILLALRPYIRILFEDIETFTFYALQQAVRIARFLAAALASPFSRSPSFVFARVGPQNVNEGL